MNSFNIKFLRSREYYWAIGAILFIGLLVAAFYWFNYYRIGDFAMRWTTGEQAGFRSRDPDFNQYGNNPVARSTVTLLSVVTQKLCSLLC